MNLSADVSRIERPFDQQDSADAPVTPDASTQVSAQLIALDELTKPESEGCSPLIESTNPLLSIKAELRVVVGRVMMSVGELLNAKAGQVISLDRDVQGVVDLVIDGKTIARGHLVAVDGRFGIRLSQLSAGLAMERKP
ncbi:MAG: FliM/FliN family flagellar motor switch protein [Betaproteobacteria bacterium]|nr:FliM/FliN family flagellar motor switch protein [Betaproteobacteria bacterium]